MEPSCVSSDPPKRFGNPLLRSGGEEESRVEMEGVEGKMLRTGVEVMVAQVFDVGVGVLRREPKVLVCEGGGDISRWLVVAMESREGVWERVGDRAEGRDWGREVDKLLVSSNTGLCRPGRDSTGRAEPKSRAGEAGRHRDGVSNPAT